MNPLNDKIFEIVGREAEALGVRAFVIGGYVRDYFLQRPCNDVDIVVEGSGIALAQRVGDLLHSKVTVFKNFGTAMLKFKGLELEFVGARKESYHRESRKPIVEDGTLEDDQLRRDFTINAMAFSLQKDDFGSLVDPFGGIRDLDAGIIKTPLNPDTTYSDDPLRMIRAVRFATQLGFTIVQESMDSIRRNRDRLSILSKERIADELTKIIGSKSPSRGFALLESCQLLEVIIPALHTLKNSYDDGVREANAPLNVEVRNGHGHKDNFRHSLQVLDNVARVSDDIWLRWAALLHDIGKGPTKKWDEKSGWSFHNHDYVGGKMIPSIFRDLKLPMNEKMKYVQKMVLLHLRPVSLVTDEVTDSAVRRLLFDAGDDVDDLMTLCRADITSKNEKKVDMLLHNYEILCQKMADVEEKDRIRNFKNPIDGSLIMDYYGIPPCHAIGEIKECVKNAILDGEIPNEYEAAFALMESKAAELGLTPVGKGRDL
ncbi:MAG: HD domain-containing protein [Bacteroidales bacterium]|nr:HD domain-containing protein [Bacteroidales bacterium]